MLSKVVKIAKTSPWTFKNHLTKIVKETCRLEEKKDFQVLKMFSTPDNNRVIKFTGEWLFKFEQEKQAKMVTDFVQNNALKMDGEGELKAFYSNEQVWNNSLKWRGVNLFELSGRAVFLHNLPYTAHLNDIKGFFPRFVVQTSDIVLFKQQNVMEGDGTALVIFPSEEEAQRAVMENDRQFLNGRRVHLILLK